MCCNLTRANDFFPGVITRHPSAYLLEPPLALPAAAKQGPTAMGAAAVLLVTLVGSVAASDAGVCENWYVHPSQPCVSFCQEAVHSDSCQRLPLGVALFPGDLLAFLARRHPLPFIRLPACQTRRTSHLMSTPDKHTRAWHCPLRSIPCASRGRGALCLLNWPR